MSIKRALALEPLDNRYPALHGLRVLAIISVVQFHVTWIFAREQGITMDPGFANGSLTIFFGMDLFFILSGFLIGSILIRSLETDGTQNLRRFYLRRISRTFPSYYVVLTLLATTLPLTVMQKKHLVWEYVYATNFMSLLREHIIMFWGWSLALEEQFYLTVPLLFIALYRMKSDRSRVLFLTALWSLALVIRIALYYAKRPWTDLALYEALYFRPHTRFDTLVCGVLLAFVHRQYGKRIEAWLETPRHRALLSLVSLSCLWILLKPHLFGLEHVQLVHVFAWGSITSVMYMGWLLLLLHGDPRGESAFLRFLSHPAFRRIATLGYGVYLVHIPVLDYLVVPVAHRLQRAEVPMVVVWPAALTSVMLLSLAIGYVMHIVIEKPSLWVREKIAG